MADYSDESVAKLSFVNINMVACQRIQRLYCAKPKGSIRLLFK